MITDYTKYSFTPSSISNQHAIPVTSESCLLIKHYLNAAVILFAVSLTIFQKCTSDGNRTLPSCGNWNEENSGLSECVLSLVESSQFDQNIVIVLRRILRTEAKTAWMLGQPFFLTVQKSLLFPDTVLLSHSWCLAVRAFVCPLYGFTALSLQG